MADADLAKRLAAARALDVVRPGMTLGLGSGSTSRCFVELLGARVAAGLGVVGVATSESTAALARSLGIPLATLDERPVLDLAIDGADEFDPQLRLVKGGGGSLLREKIVAAAASRMVVIADARKQVATLGGFPLPVEVVPFGLAAIRRSIARAASASGCAGELHLRQSGDHPFVTDGGHYILDCAFGIIPDPEALAAALDAVSGVVEHGLFIGFASAVIVADASGTHIVGDLG